jgi:hypothetical protein
VYLLIGFFRLERVVVLMDSINITGVVLKGNTLLCVFLGACQGLPGPGAARARVLPIK